MRRHDHFHEIFGDAIAALAFNQNLVNLTVVKIADRPFDQIAFFINFSRCCGFQCQFANLLPEPLQIFIITLDFRFGALGTRCSDNQPRTLRDINFMGDFFKLFAIRGIGYLAANAAPTRRVWHQHTIPARQRKIGGQGSAFIAALFFDHLNQHNLADFDDLLYFVPPRTRLADLAQIKGIIVISDVFDAFILFRSRAGFIHCVVVFIFAGLIRSGRLS